MRAHLRISFPDDLVLDLGELITQSVKFIQQSLELIVAGFAAFRTLVRDEQRRVVRDVRVILQQGEVHGFDDKNLLSVVREVTVYRCLRLHLPMWRSARGEIDSWCEPLAMHM